MNLADLSNPRDFLLQAFGGFVFTGCLLQFLASLYLGPRAYRHKRVSASLGMFGKIVVSFDVMVAGLVCVAGVGAWIDGELRESLDVLVVLAIPAVVGGMLWTVVALSPIDRMRSIRS
jgi:hypothetical protein